MFNSWFYRRQTRESQREEKVTMHYLSCEHFPKNNAKAKDIGFLIIWFMFNNLPYAKESQVDYNKYNEQQKGKTYQFFSCLT